MGYDVTITRTPMRALFELGGDLSALVRWGGDVLAPLPDTPLAVHAGNGRMLLATGPGHWLLSAPIGAETALIAALRPDAAPAEISIVAVSDMYAFLAVTGPGARDVMAVATPLDLDPVAGLRAGQAAWTEAFGAKALIRPVSEGFEIAIERSYADWFEACLTASAG